MAKIVIRRLPGRTVWEVHALRADGTWELDCEFAAGDSTAKSAAASARCAQIRARAVTSPA